MTEPVVHILHHGRPLCGAFPGKVPRDWPEGHKWVGLDERHLCSCGECVAIALRVFGGRFPKRGGKKE